MVCGVPSLTQTFENETFYVVGKASSSELVFICSIIGEVVGIGDWLGERELNGDTEEDVGGEAAQHGL